MFVNEDIIEIEIENEKYSAIAFSNKITDLPAFLLQGEKQPGYLFKDGKKEPWYWHGFTNYNGKKCFYYEPIKLYPLSQLASSLRSKAPKLIINLAKALSLCDSKFLDLQNGIISAWRIYFTKDDDVLILPRMLSDIFSSTTSETTRFNNSNSFIHANILPSFTLIDQMAQLFYYSITSIKPFEYTSVRNNHYKAINLSLLVNALKIDADSELVLKVNSILNLSLNKTRDISSNLEPQKALSPFIEMFSDVEWQLENTADKNISIEDLLHNEISGPKIDTLLKKEKAIVFWRKRGTLIIVCAIIAVSLIAFTGGRIKEALRPPYTAGLEPPGVILAYYEAQNSLDIQNLEDSLKRRVKSPISTELTTLFVTNQTRLAYEHVETIINPVQWVENNMPPIAQTKILYGVDEVELKKINDYQILASCVYYSPDSPDRAESLENPQLIGPSVYKCYRYDQEQVFSFEYNDRGWYEISDITTTHFKYKDTLLIPTFAANDPSYDVEADERKTEIVVEEHLKDII